MWWAALRKRLRRCADAPMATVPDKAATPTSVSVNYGAGVAPVSTRPRHPNDVDRRRILRALASRARYRYVEPTVSNAEEGYRIDSPCCSRNVDPEGGVVPVAWVQYQQGPVPWRLYYHDHKHQQWCLHSLYDRLDELLQELNADPQRKFWQ